MPLIDEAAVRIALDRLRQGRPLDDSPLRRLIWVREQIGAAAGRSSIQVDVALFDTLTAVISERLAELRHLEQLPSSNPASQKQAWDAIRADFARGNAELEAWSFLYYRYVKIDFDWQVQQIEAELGMSERNLRRRMQHGIRRLAETISRRETEARRRNQRLWLEMKLPPAASVLVGAEDEVGQIGDLLNGDGRTAGVMAIGPGGIGKTAICREAALRVLKAGSFSNVIWLCLDEPTPYQMLIALIALDFNFQQVGEQELVSLEAALRLPLERTPTLVVIDDADLLLDPADSIPRLARLIAPGRLLLTGRKQPPAEVPLQMVQIKPLNHAAFSQLIKRVARDRRARAAAITPETLDVLYATLGGNPLAGRLVASQLGVLPLNRIIANLSTLQTAEGSSLFDRIFGAVWETLDDDARRTAMAIILLPPDGAYWHDILAMADLSSERLDRSLHQLRSCSLLEVDPESSCYMMHGLTRLFVEEQAQQPPFDSIYRDVLHAAIVRERNEARLQDDLVPVPANSPARVTQTLSLLHRELQTGFELRTLSELVEKLAPEVRRSGLWTVWRDALLRIEERMRSEGAHPADLCQVLLEIGVAQRWLGRPEEAAAYLEETIATSGNEGDFTVQAEALLELARLQEAQGQSADAYESAQRSASVAYRYGAIQLRRRALIQLIDLALVNNQAGAAQQLAVDALRTFHDEEPDGVMLSTLGMVRLRNGDTVQAAHYQQQALEAFQAAGDLPGIGRAYLRLGIICQEGGDLDGALQALGEGLQIIEQIGDALGRARTLSNLGAVQFQRAQFADALDLWLEAIRLQDQLGDQVGMAHTWYNLAILHWELGSKADARRAFAEAKQLAELFGLVTLLSRMRNHPLNTL